jgi:hypothetical protein
MYDNERDKEILQAPYKKIQAAEDLVNSNALLDLYVVLYKKKYKDEPLFGVNKEHLNLIRSFSKSAGHKSYGLLEHFFEMKDDWFHKQAHSLSCLMNNLGKVHASYSQKNAVARPAGTMRINTFCDACWGYFVLEAPGNYNFDKPKRCSDCIDNNVPLKRVTKEERAKAVKIISKSFPEIPS